MKRGINIIDDFLPNPKAYVGLFDGAEFQSFEFPEATFHGIHPVELDSVVPDYIAEVTGGTPCLSFLRRSPLHQVEPHFIHTDTDMGKWSSILYLNEDAPEGDGTSFWTYQQNGAIESEIPHERSEEGKTRAGWLLRELIPSKFNRLLVFPSAYFHSRSIFENWGTAEKARLTQVTFGTGDIFA